MIWRVPAARTGTSGLSTIFTHTHQVAGFSCTPPPGPMRHWAMYLPPKVPVSHEAVCQSPDPGWVVGFGMNAIATESLVGSTGRPAAVAVTGTRTYSRDAAAMVSNSDLPDRPFGDRVADLPHRAGDATDLPLPGGLAEDDDQVPDGALGCGGGALLDEQQRAPPVPGQLVAAPLYAIHTTRDQQRIRRVGGRGERGLVVAGGLLTTGGWVGEPGGVTQQTVYRPEERGFEEGRGEQVRVADIGPLLRYGAPVCVGGRSVAGPGGGTPKQGRLQKRGRQQARVEVDALLRYQPPVGELDRGQEPALQIVRAAEERGFEQRGVEQPRRGDVGALGRNKPPVQVRREQRVPGQVIRRAE